VDNQTSTVNLTINAVADLSITNTGPTTITAGTNATYTIVVTSTGPNDAPNVSLTDALPSGTTFVSESHPTGFTPSTPSFGSTGTVTESATTLANGASATFIVVVRANASNTNGSTIGTTASVGSSAQDPTAADDTSPTSATVATSAALSLNMSGPTTVSAGNQLTYTVAVSNGGPSDAQNVSLTDTLPAGETFVSQSQPSTGPHVTLTNAGTAISDSISTLPAGAAQTITIVATVNASQSNGSTLTNTVAATQNVGTGHVTPITAQATTTVSAPTVPPPSPPLTGNVTSSVTVTLVPAVKGKKGKAAGFSATLTIHNKLGQAIAGPLNVVLTGLKSTIKLKGAAGSVGTKKKKVPFVVVNPPGGVLQPGATISMTLTFNARPNAVTPSVFADVPPT
jgi:uncharacterized repeat protein (TIGR01451 family)